MITKRFPTDDKQPIAYRDLHYYSVEPLCAGLEPAQLVDEFIAPTERHFIRNHASVPHLDLKRHAVAIDGLVDHPTFLGVDDLAEFFPRASVVATLQCAGNRRRELDAIKNYENEILWTGDAIGTAMWSGVRLADIIRHVGFRRKATHVWFEGADSIHGAGGPSPFGSSIAIERALEDDVLLATDMNGSPLPHMHGAPLRVVVPGTIGARSVKWLTRITLADRASDNPFQASGYRFIPPGEAGNATSLTDMPLNSFICVPADKANVIAGDVGVRGYATGRGLMPVSAVEVSVDDDEWRAVELLDEPAPGAWVRWEAAAQLNSGQHTIRVRASDTAGNVQPPDVAARWNVRGYVNDGWHSVQVTAVALQSNAGR